jgi:anti-sigma regulatory factor (Ser/Thr protein kinase)
VTTVIRHDLLVYDSDERFVAQLEPYLVAGLEVGELVMAILDDAKQAILRDAIGADIDQISFIDPVDVYVRPESALAVVDAAVRTAAEPSSPDLRIYGELPACRNDAEWRAWMSYEAVVNVAFDDQRPTLMCGYDARIVPATVIELARKTHRVVHDGAWQLSADYAEPAALMRSLAPPFEPMPDLRELPLGGARGVEERLADELTAASLPEARARDLLVAAREVLSNAERYGNGVRSLRVGRVGEQFVCEVTDSGRGLDDPRAGFMPPRPLATNHAGLWIARQLTARLELHSRRDGLTVRLWG